MEVGQTPANRSSTTTARHLMVSFNVKQYAGSQFAYPADWLPAVSAATISNTPGQFCIHLSGSRVGGHLARL